MDEIEAKYKEFYDLPFPNGLTGMEIGDIDLVLLDSDTAGLVDKYISFGKLNQVDYDKLNICFNELSIVIKELTGQDRAYFKVLFEIVKMVIDN